MEIKKRWSGRLVGGLFLLCAVGFLWLLGIETVPRQEPVWLEPKASVAPPYTGPLELEYVLPAYEGELRPLLEIRVLSTEAELLLDGQPFQRISDGLGWAYLTLPPDSSGKTLTLVTEIGEGDTIPVLYLTDDGIIREQSRADTSLYAFPAAAFGVIFLLTLGLFLYGALEGAKPWPVLLLSAAALGQAVYFYLNNLSTYSLPSAIYGLALWQSRALLFAAPSLYLLLSMKKRRRVFAPFAILPAAIYWVVAGFQTVVPLFSDIAAHVGILFCFTIAALLVCAVLEARDGNPVFRHFLTWLGACAAMMGVLCVVSLVRRGALPPTLEAFLTAPLTWLNMGLFCWNSLLLVLCLMDSVAAFIRHVAQRDTEMRVLSARESLTREQLATVRESAAALSELRHEMKSHYLVLQNLNRAGEPERLEAYLSELVSEADSIPAMTYAPHPAINAVLTAMLARAQKQGIEVERRVDVPETLPFPDTELCTVLMNLLQNALEANTLAPEGVRKWMRVDLHIRGVHLYMGVENSRFAPVDYDGETGLCRTTKDDKSAHGYGLKAVQTVARKYQSELVLKFPEGSFSAATALQMPD